MIVTINDIPVTQLASPSGNPLLTFEPVTDEFVFNPFTAPTCKISGLKDARTRLRSVYFPQNT